MSDHQDRQFQHRSVELNATAKKGRGRPSKIMPVRNGERQRSRSRQDRRQAPRSRSNSSHSAHSSHDSEAHLSEQASGVQMPALNANLEQYINFCRILFIDFFKDIGQGKGFVFTTQERAKMIKEMTRYYANRSINWNKQHNWNPTTEKEKLNLLWDSANISLPEKHLKDIKEMVHQLSSMFCDETTDELYQLMSEVIKIASGQKSQQVQSIRNLNRNIRAGNQYKFFSYKFSKHFKLSITERQFQTSLEVLLSNLAHLIRQKLQ